MEAVQSYSKLRPIPDFTLGRRTGRPTGHFPSDVPVVPDVRFKVAQRLSPEQFQNLLQAYATGTPTRALMAQYKIGKGTVLRILNEASLTRTQAHLTERQIEEAGTLYANGWSLQRLADRYGFEHDTVGRALKRAGIVIRRPWDHLR